MKLHELREPEGTKHRPKRRGRGIAAGQGKSSGYGTKGQGVRAKHGPRPYFEGGQLPLVKRLPHKRGFHNVNRVAYTVVNLGVLNCFEAGSVVDPARLVAAGLIKEECLPVKVLGQGEMDRPLTIKADKFSESAKQKIVAAGGTVEEL